MKKWFTCLNEKLASLALGEMFILLNLPTKIIIRHALSMSVFQWHKQN